MSEGRCLSVSCCVSTVRDLWIAAKQPGVMQIKALALTRTVVGVASTAIAPLYAAGGGALGVILPQPTKLILEYVDGAVTGLWDSMGFREKVVLTAVGIPLASYGYGFDIAAAVLAAKLGAELGVKNVQKQTVSYAKQQIAVDEQKEKAQ